MKLFQITEITESLHHAGTKATADFTSIADSLGFERLPVRMVSTAAGVADKARRQVGYYKDWEAAFDRVAFGSVVLLQHPFHHRQLTREKVLKKMKRKKKVRFISVVHDVEKLRAFRYNDYYAREFQTMVELADALIVHNQVMLEWFVTQGVAREKLIDLKVFDYLVPRPIEKKVLFSRSITVAGNLDTTKCGYIKDLCRLRDMDIHLYGPNYDENMQTYENVTYHGSFPVDEIPEQLDRGFGLVWDGESIDGCLGASGQYLRYNNPHKLSLFLASGLPVVIWDEAAEADFVRKHQVGICVKSVQDLEGILQNYTEDAYRSLLRNVATIGKKLIRGAYGDKAIKEALNVTKGRS